MFVRNFPEIINSLAFSEIIGENLSEIYYALLFVFLDCKYFIPKKRKNLSFWVFWMGLSDNSSKVLARILMSLISPYRKYF